MRYDSESIWPKRSETEQRRMDAELLYDFEMEARRQGFLADPALVYDEEHDLFKFRDGRFAISQEHAKYIRSPEPLDGTPCSATKHDHPSAYSYQRQR